MIRYLLDSNALIQSLNDPTGVVATAVFAHEADELGTSSVVLYELVFGAYKSARPETNLAALERLSFPVLSFDAEDGREAGRLRAHLRSQGRPIGPYNLLIAGQALRRGLTVVTGNLREFERVPGLMCEDWSR